MLEPTRLCSSSQDEGEKSPVRHEEPGIEPSRSMTLGRTLGCGVNVNAHQSEDEALTAAVHESANGLDGNMTSHNQGLGNEEALDSALHESCRLV